MTRAAVAILQSNNRILICQRRRGSSYELRWEFPGGKLEPGESITDCLKRELREELSLDIGSIGRTETMINHYSDGNSFEVTYCFVDRFSGTPVNNSFEAIRWVTVSELQSFDILEGNRAIAAKLAESKPL